MGSWRVMLQRQRKILPSYILSTPVSGWPIPLKIALLHSPESVTRPPGILCWLNDLHMLSLSNLYHKQSYSCAPPNVDWIYEWMATFSTFDAMSRWLHFWESVFRRLFYYSHLSFLIKLWALILVLHSRPLLLTPECGLYSKVRL